MSSDLTLPGQDECNFQVILSLVFKRWIDLIPDLANPLVHPFDKVDTGACSAVFARVAGILQVIGVIYVAI